MITTTHAKPPSRSLSAGMLTTTTLLRCDRCADVLGTAANEEQRSALKRTHRCRDLQVAHKPSIAVPFS
jgi:hypothetical protein